MKKSFQYFILHIGNHFLKFLNRKILRIPFFHWTNRNKNPRLRKKKKKQNLGKLLYIPRNISVVGRLIKKKKFQLSSIISNEPRVEKMAENCHGKEVEKSCSRGLCIQKLHLVAYITEMQSGRVISPPVSGEIRPCRISFDEDELRQVA